MRSNVPDYVKEYVARAEQFEREDRYDEAIAVYRQALALYPNIAVLHNNLGCHLVNQEKYEEAKREFQKALALTPVNRQAGIVIPDSYPEEPRRNLRAAEAYSKGTFPAPLPARAPMARSPLQFYPFHPGMSFPQYVFWFVFRNPLGCLLTIAASIVLSILWKSNSAYLSMAIGIASITLLALAYIAFVADPRLRKKVVPSRLSAQYYVLVGLALGIVLSILLGTLYVGKTSLAEISQEDILTIPLVVRVAPAAVGLLIGVALRVFASGRRVGPEKPSPFGGKQSLLDAEVSALGFGLGTFFGLIAGLMIFFFAQFPGRGLCSHVLFGLFFGQAIGGAIGPLSSKLAQWLRRT
jgi:hypothetical protein